MSVVGRSDDGLDTARPAYSATMLQSAVNAAVSQSCLRLSAASGNSGTLASQRWPRCRPPPSPTAFSRSPISTKSWPVCWLLIWSETICASRCSTVTPSSCKQTASRPVRLNELDFVVVDVEATGAKMPPNRIIELGAYRIQKGRIVDEFVTLVNPELPIPRFVMTLTRITNDMVKGCSGFCRGGAALAGVCRRRSARRSQRTFRYELSESRNLARVPGTSNGQFASLHGDALATHGSGSGKLSSRYYSRSFLDSHCSNGIAPAAMHWPRPRFSSGCSRPSTTMGCATWPRRERFNCSRNRLSRRP